MLGDGETEVFRIEIFVHQNQFARSHQSTTTHGVIDYNYLNILVT